MDKEELIHKLEEFRSKAFCHYSHAKAHKLYQEVIIHIPSQYARHISTEWQHVQLRHGFTQACSALNTEINKFIKYLRGEDESAKVVKKIHK